jgi:hypothetical protein
MMTLITTSPARVPAQRSAAHRPAAAPTSRAALVLLRQAEQFVGLVTASIPLR